jgi:hypothetical protein
MDLPFENTYQEMRIDRLQKQGTKPKLGSAIQRAAQADELS